MIEPASYPPTTDTAFPAREKNRAFAMLDRFVEHDLPHLWPAFDYDMLVDLDDRDGKDRLRAQFYKSNVEPTDRYTLSLKGSIASRLTAGGSGVENLFLCGDWVDNGFNAGCVEATVMSGMQCARAITGEAIDIIGEPARLKRRPRALTARCYASHDGETHGTREHRR